MVWYYVGVSIEHFRPRTCECKDLQEISGKLVEWKDPTNPKGEWDPSHQPTGQIFLSDLCTNIVLGFISYLSLFSDSFSGLQF